MTNDSIVSAFRTARAHGLKTYSFNMVGAPGETFRDYLATVRLNRRIMPDAFQITTYYPFPGSELYTKAEASGLIDHAGHADNYLSHSLLSMKQFPKWQIRYASETFPVRVYAGEKPGLRLYLQLLRILISGWLRSKGITRQKIRMLFRLFSGCDNAQKAGRPCA